MRFSLYFLLKVSKLPARLVGRCRQNVVFVKTQGSKQPSTLAVFSSSRCLSRFGNLLSSK
jgi:hypothetical protein